MFSGSMMTLNIHGINKGSKEEKPDEAKVRAREKEKEKAEVAEDLSDQDSKAEAKAEEKAALTWWEKGYEDEWQEEDEWNEYAAVGPMIKTGIMPFGAQMNYTTRMSMVCSGGKEKERKERKARKEKTMKEKANKEMAKANQTMYSHPLHRIKPRRIIHNRFIIQIPQHRVQGMVLFLLLKRTGPGTC